MAIIMWWFPKQEEYISALNLKKTQMTMRTTMMRMSVPAEGQSPSAAMPTDPGTVRNAIWPANATELFMI